MRSIDDTHFPDSIRENVPVEWREVVRKWVESHLGTLIPRVYLDHDFVQWVAGSVEPLFLNHIDPSYSFFRSLPPELARSFNPGDVVNISFNVEAETVFFLGEGRWNRTEREEANRPCGKAKPTEFKPRFSIGIWPGLEDFDC